MATQSGGGAEALRTRGRSRAAPVLERMKVHHPHLWEALHRVHFSHEAGPAQLEDWRRAPKGSQEDIWAEHYDEAMGVLRMGLQ